MFRGTERYPQEKYNDVAQGAGRRLERLHDRRLDLLPHGGARRGRWRRSSRSRPTGSSNLKYDEPDFQKEARAVLGEYNKSASSPFQLDERGDAGRRLHDAHLQAHDDRLPRRHQGHAQPVRLQQAFFDRWYRPENCTIDRRRRRRAAERRRARRAGLRRLEAGQRAGDDPRRAGADGAQTAHRRLAEPRRSRTSTSATTSPADPTTRHGLGGARRPGAGRSSARPARSTRSSSSRSRRSTSCQADAERQARPRPVHDRGAGPQVRRLVAEVAGGSSRPLRRGRQTKPIDPSTLDRDQGAPPLRLRRLARQRRRASPAVGQSIAITGRPDAMNDLYAAYDRLTAGGPPARRPALLQPDQRDGRDPGPRGRGSGGPGQAGRCEVDGSYRQPCSPLATARRRGAGRRDSANGAGSRHRGGARSPARARRWWPSGSGFDVGSIDDPAGKEGLAALTAR